MRLSRKRCIIAKYKRHCRINPHKSGKSAERAALATITVTEDGQTVFVSNGDRVIIDIPGGGTVTIVAEKPNVRNFRVDYADDESAASTAILDLDSFQRDDLQVLVSGYDLRDTMTLEGAENVQIGVPQENTASFGYGNGLSGKIKILDPGERDLSADPPPLVICFANGTIIETELGPRPVESILPGDLVRTVDNGRQPVKWVGRRELDTLALLQNPNLLPVRVSKGALGNDQPWTDLVVSPQHRIFLEDWRAELLFGDTEVLVPAKALVGLPGIEVCRNWTGCYYHLLFERHELVWSNGLITESLHPGEVALSALSDKDQEVVSKMVKKIAAATQTTRPAIRVHDAKALGSYAA